ncbi:MAG TPA: hypothetical protein VF283_23780 [Bryobacteraceae bacterium]
MDTREKIVALAAVPALLAGAEWTTMTGYFDPMTAAQAKRIARSREPGRKLLVVVLDDGEALLSATARAALVAALRAVDAVAIARPGEWPLADADAERARTAGFVQFILDRQGAVR